MQSSLSLLFHQGMRTTAEGQLLLQPRYLSSPLPILSPRGTPCFEALRSQVAFHWAQVCS